jgi:hypothetical protein
MAGVPIPADTAGQSFTFIKCRPSRKKTEYIEMKDTAMPRFPAHIAGTRNTLGGIRIHRR